MGPILLVDQLHLRILEVGVLELFLEFVERLLYFLTNVVVVMFPVWLTHGGLGRGN